MTAKKIISCLLALLVVLSAFPMGMGMAESTVSAQAEETMDYMRLKNLPGPSGVALGGIGVGYYEIDPTGRVIRNCINNIHESFANAPAGFLVGAWDGTRATRLQRDGDTQYGMKGYQDSYYTGLWPYMNLDFENSHSGAANMGFSAYSGLSAQNVKDSSLPVVYYDVVLKNDSSSAKTMSALLTWGDVIGRGVRDSQGTNINLDGGSSDWSDLTTPQTYAKGVQVSNGGTTYTGVMQYAKGSLSHKRATFQNYNNAFMILAEDTGSTEVTVLKNFNVNDNNAFASYNASGKLNGFDGGEVVLSSPTAQSRTTTNGSAVAVSSSVPANGEVTVKLMVSWFMPEITEAEYANMIRFSTCDFNKYYHNSFSSIEQLTSYAIGIRDAQLQGIKEWQDPILNSSMPDWLKFKQINSGYTLYACGVLNKRGNFSTLEGAMGGYGGTMDQKMSSYPVYEKLFPELNLTENRQFANVTGANGEIQHFDIHYYYGMSDYENKDNPTPAGSMIDNTGTWMMQMWNHYRQTGSEQELRNYYGVMKTSLQFLQSKYLSGTHIPSYNTTYDDFSHPDVMVYSGTVWLHMLDLAEKWATLMGDSALAAEYAAERQEAYEDVELYYGTWSADLGYDAFYAYGSDGTFLSSGGQSGEVESAIMFSGAMAGQFISRMNGQGDVVPFDQFVSHMKTFLQTSVQKASDYMAAKIYNIRTEQALDWLNSNCWPFYLESYGGMAAIQAGYLEDGLEILEHTSLVDLRLGYTWTRSLWTRDYITYMTAPVSWMLGDVLAGASVDAPQKTLTLGPSCIASEGVGVSDSLEVPLYYPKYWATLKYDKNANTFTYKITKTFYEQGESPIAIRQVVAHPAGVKTEGAQTITLDSDFLITEGASLDLSAHMAKFQGVTKEKLLQPVPEYEPPKPQKEAKGTGLKTSVRANGQTVSLPRTEKVNFLYNSENRPLEGVTGEYELVLEGRIMPRYTQKYQLLFEYTGAPEDLVITFAGSEVTDYGDSIEDVESQQFTPTPGTNLRVITQALEEGKFYNIKITHKGNVANGKDNILRFLWWSTTQPMGLVIKERMYPTVLYDDLIDGTEYTDSTCQVEGDHMAYTVKGSHSLYEGIDFEQGGQNFKFRIRAAAIRSELSSGGTVEIRRGSKTGELLGTLNFTPTSDTDWNNYVWFETDLHSDQGLSGTEDICLVFNPNSNFLFNYTQFTFENKDSARTTDATSVIDGKNYFEATAKIEEDHMAWTTADTYALYRNLNFGQTAGRYTFKIMAGAIDNEHSTGGTLELRQGGPSGELLGSLAFTPTGAWNAYKEQSIVIEKPLMGVQDICLVFRPLSTYLLNYTTFTFEREPIDATSAVDGKDFFETTARIEGDHMAYTQKNTYALYENLDFGQTPSRFLFKIMAGAIENEVSAGGTMELRLDGPLGKLLGTLSFRPTGDWAKYEEQVLEIQESLSGVQDICLVFHPDSTFLFNYTTFTFEAIIPEDPDKIAAEEVMEIIEALPQEITLADKEAVENARRAVEALTDAGKAMVTNLQKLTDAEAAISALQKAEADKAAADAFAALINALQVEDLSDKVDVVAARAAYTALTDDQKALVAEDVLAKLIAAEDAIRALEEAADKEEVDRAAADAVSALINTLPEELALEDKAAVEAARAAYEALTDDQKALVTNLADLTDAETTIAELQAAADKAAADAVTDAIDALTGESTEQEVAAVRATYEGLTEAQKALVPNETLEKLVSLENAFHQPEINYGDVDGNGKVDAADALKALQHAVKLITLEGETYTAADVNGDDKIDAADALLMLQYTVKLIDKFPVETVA